MIKRYTPRLTTFGEPMMDEDVDGEWVEYRVCRWTKDPDGYYRSGCKVCNNRVTTTFCQYCGGKVEVV